MSVGMVFALIFTIVLMAFVILFGWDAVTRLLCFGENSKVQKSIDQIKDLVENHVYPKSKGFSEIYELNVPEGTRFCFVNSTDPRPNILGNWEPDTIYQNMIKENKYTLWVKHCGGQSGYRIDHLYIPPDRNFCVKTGARLYFENHGRYVTVEVMAD